MKTSKKGFSSIIVLLIAVGVLVLGTAGYYIARKTTAVGDNGKSDILPPLVGGDRDVHGCIGSAGYSWCEAKNKCLRPWEEKCENVPAAVPSSASSNAPFQNSPAVPSNTLSYYSNSEYGISFQYPSKYVMTKAPKGYEGILPIFTYNDTQNKTPHVPDVIDVRWLPFKTGVSPEQVLIDDVVYDGSGIHPKSFDEFTLVHLGDNDFYKIRTGLFEGVLGYRYYLIRDSGAFDFVLTGNGVPWTDPLFNSENYARKLELEEMLKTVKLNI